MINYDKYKDIYIEELATVADNCVITYKLRKYGEVDRHYGCPSSDVPDEYCNEICAKCEMLNKLWLQSDKDSFIWDVLERGMNFVCKDADKDVEYEFVSADGDKLWVRNDTGDFVITIKELEERYPKIEVVW